MDDINEPDDLLGMLPTEIVAAFAAERKARQEAEQDRDEYLRRWRIAEQKLVALREE